MYEGHMSAGSLNSVVVATRWARVMLAGWVFLVAAGAACAADSAPLAVWVIGLPHGYIVMEHQVAVLHVTADDVARGVLEVRDGSRLVITTHSVTGYVVDFSPRSRLFEAVRIEGIGGPVELGGMGGAVVERDALAGRRVVPIHYRFILAPGTTVGTHAWPLQVGVRALVDEPLLAFRDESARQTSLNVSYRTERHGEHEDDLIIGGTAAFP
jgi:hypothetical protein